MPFVGERIVRKEDPVLMTGRAEFYDDIRPEACMAMAFVRSTYAHAKILSIDTSEAAAMPGVLAVYTIDDFADYGMVPGVPGMDRPMLARDIVRFVGESVAIVVAEDNYLAADAVEAVVVDYEPLEVVNSVADAMADGAPVLHEAIGSNVLLDTPWADDIEAVFSAAPRTASLKLWNNRVHPAPMEPNGVVADWSGQKATLWVSHQAPHHLRNTLATYLGITHSDLRIVMADVGGAFGAKIQWYPENFLAPIISNRLGRPVKYTQTRSECFMLMMSARDQHHEAEIAFDDEGTILGVRSMLYANAGAYPDVPIALGMPTLTNWMTSGCYKIPALATGHKVVATNHAPLSSYRGAGRPEACYLIERLVDLVVSETGLDPVDVRMRNFIPPEDFPYTVPHAEVEYDSGSYAETLNEALRLIDYDNLKAERDRRNNDPSEKLMGIGFSSWVEIASFGPRGALEGFGHIGSYESSQVKVQPDGSVIISTGASPHGQGTVTTLAQIAADELGMHIDQISVKYGDTDSGPQGIGTMGSRIAAIAGSATKEASIQVVDSAKKVAAHLMEANPDDIEVVDGNFSVKGTPARSVSWGEVGWASMSPTQLPDGLSAGSLDQTVFFEPTGFTFPSGTYICVVGIDRTTGEVEVEKFLAVDDCGTVLNPLLAEGQVEGGIIQGIAQALYEEMRYDDNAQPLTASFMDYLAPAASDVPRIDSGRTNTPTPHNTLGAKGIGESGAIGSPPAVVNACVDALRQFGINHIDMPVTPQKVWRVLNNSVGG
jgi:carbon-monoxide dehydrogenase large subunit